MMEQRKKLIELLKQDPELFFDRMGSDDYENLADHLLANGVVVLPCKIGDTVYVIDVTRVCLVSRKIRQLRIAEIIYTDHGIYVMGEHGEGEYALNECYLTREGAERALAKRKGGDE